MWMVFVRRSKSFKSVFSSTTCFNASCAGEPATSHFVLRCALGEMGSCAQRLYSTVESQSCLSAVWWRMLTHFSLRSWGLPSQVIADHRIWFVTDFIQGERSLHSFFLASVVFLVKCHTSTRYSTPRSLYSLLISALIPVCLSVPTTPTGMPSFSARSRQRLNHVSPLPVNLYSALHGKLRNRQFSHSLCPSWCKFRIWHYSLGSHNVHPRGE